MKMQTQLTKTIVESKDKFIGINACVNEKSQINNLSFQVKKLEVKAKYETSRKKEI